MTNFDNLLKAAFEAGSRHGEGVCARQEGYRVDDADMPSFDEWRATVSGLDTREDLGPLAVGDRAKVLPSWGAPFEEYHGIVGEVLEINSYGDVHMSISHPRASGVFVPLAHVEKVR